MIALGTYLHFYGLLNFETDYISFKICALIMPLVLIYIDFGITASLMYNVQAYDINKINNEYNELLGDYYCINSTPVKNMILETKQFI